MNDFKVKLELSLDDDIKIESPPSGYEFEVPWEQPKWSYNEPPADESPVDPNSYEELKKKGLFRCELCPRMFSTRYRLAQHEMNHICMFVALPPLYNCDICSAIFVEKKSLSKHIRYNCGVRQPKKAYKCNICNKSYKYRHWYSHMRNVHGASHWTCDICAKKFKCERYLIRHHLYIHEDRKPLWMLKKKGVDGFLHQCFHCSKAFKSRDCLNQHFKNVHESDGKTFTCEICFSELRSEAYLRTHMKRVHYDDGLPHKCHVCVKNFKSRRSMNVHMKNVHLKRVKPANYVMLPHGCSICAETFKSPLYLKIHMKNVHAKMPKSKKSVKLRPECKICAKTFQSPRYLKSHTRKMHQPTVESSNECNICGHNFKLPKYLKAHMKNVHPENSEESSNNCNICERKFKIPRYLKVHMRNVHGINEEKSDSVELEAPPPCKIVKVEHVNNMEVEHMKKMEVKFEDASDNDLLIDMGKGPVTNIVSWENM